MHDRYETSSRGDDCRCRKGAKCASCMGLTQPERSEAPEDARSPFAVKEALERVVRHPSRTREHEEARAFARETLACLSAADQPGSSADAPCCPIPGHQHGRRAGSDGQVAARPATRVDDVVIFAGGASRELTADELRRLDAGEDVRLDPRSGRRTLLVGESLPSMTTGELIFAFEGYVD
jgi:hypothetical protein